jgi:methionyl aminopeptidase
LLPDIPLKTSLEVAYIRKSCRLAESCLNHLGSLIEAGITTRDLDREAERFIEERNAVPSLKGYKGFPSAACISVNNVAAHGIPDGYCLEEGDILSVDITLAIEGWHGDAAWTYIVGSHDDEVARLRKAAWQANTAGILAVKAGATIGDIGHAISESVRRNGCSAIEDYVGHGIGREMHEEPRVPNFGNRGEGLRIVPGMVFTIEPMVNLGSKEVKLLEDGWTVIAADNNLSAQYEHTLAVFSDRVEILTAAYDLMDHIDLPPQL